MQELTTRVPETFEGYAILHEFFHLDWPRFKALEDSRRKKIVADWKDFQAKQNKDGYRSAFYGVLGHKGDLLAIHFKPTYEELLSAQTSFRHVELADYLRKSDSYVSVVELGMYEYTVKLEEQLVAQGLKPDSEEWSAAWKTAMLEQRERILSRLYSDIPKNKFVCFYPMNKRRGEQVNWYATPIRKRQEMMRDHGMIGRKYAGQVTQVISGSIGFDDWEWGVDLFSDNPLVFKKLVYEMRFDEASSMYGEFGPFALGVHLTSENFEPFLEGNI